MRRVAVTGATGFLGANVALELCRAGYEVRGLCRNLARAKHLAGFPIDWRLADLSNVDSLKAAFRGVDAVIHCAGDTTQARWMTADQLRVNVLGTRQVIKASAAAHVMRLVHCSSTTTCGVSVSANLVDEDSCRRGESKVFTDGYTQSKILAEKLSIDAALRLDTVVVNPGFLVGPLDVKPSSGRLLTTMARGSVLGWPKGVNCFVDVRCVARGIRLALERGRKGERYILGGENLSYRMFMYRGARALGIRPPAFPIPHSFAVCAGAIGDLMQCCGPHPIDVNSATVAYGYSQGFRFSSAKAQKELGYRYRGVDDAIQDAIAWFRETGMLPR